MAMFLSRIKKALNVGSKSITVNGTYYASADGYDGYDEVTVNVAGVTPTPITPSNASPVALTSGNAVTPSANGYAIESYYNLTPSNNPAVINNDRIYKPTVNGFAIHEFFPLTPSDSTPPLMTSGKFYKPSTNGYLYATQQPTLTDITPSNNSPVALTADNPVNPLASGYAISSYSSKTPSDSSPASVSSGAIIKASAAGYLYASSGLKKVKTGSVSLTANTNNTITTGFQPKYICWNVGTGSLCAYNEDISTTQFRKASSSGISNVNVGTSASYNLISISSTGFVIRGASSAVTMNYFAIG